MTDEVAQVVLVPTASDIIERVQKYNKNCNVSLLTKAYDWCIDHHGKHFRKSNEPYYTHPIAVAGYVIDMNLDDETIITALLHDIVEDTPVTLEMVVEHFSQNIADLVDGVTKLDKIQFQPYQFKQAENFRKLFIALSRDIRVLIVKLCDRLHNMRTLQFQSRYKIRQIAIETIEIYAPLAERVGMYGLKDELQDTAFAAINARARNSVLKRIEVILQNLNLGTKTTNAIESIVQEFKDLCGSSNIHAEVYSRIKTPYSIWKKIVNKKIVFEQIFDIVGFRIIAKDIDECYRIFGLIHKQYHAVPGGFMDYISTPKANGYRSLHTVIFGPLAQKMEIQIRTTEMHHDAEFGMAAHWSYKQGVRKIDSTAKGVNLWIRKVMHIMDDSPSAEEFFEATKLEMYQEQLFIFTKKGDVVTLPKGSSVVDLAFAVKHELGLHCIGANVNGLKVGREFILSNGDHAQVLIDPTVRPSISWLSFAISGRAKAAIKKITKQDLDRSMISSGELIWRKVLLNNYPNIDYEWLLVEVRKNLGRKSSQALFLDIAQGKIDPIKEAKKVISNLDSMSINLSQKQPFFAPSDSHDSAVTYGANSALLMLKYDHKLVVHLCPVCRPVPSDSIVGIAMPDVGFIVHNPACRVISFSCIFEDSKIQFEWR